MPSFHRCEAAFRVSARHWPNYRPPVEFFATLEEARHRAIQVVRWNWQILHSADISVGERPIERVERRQKPQIAPPPAGLSGESEVILIKYEEKWPYRTTAEEVENA